MGLFNQNYHIQIHMHKLQLEKKMKKKKKQKTKMWGARRILGKDYWCVYIYIYKF